MASEYEAEDEAEADEALEPGTEIGAWRVEHTLGSGGMGTVVAVVHADIGKRAALKVVHRHALSESYTAEKFLVEARAVNAVDHPNIVDIFDSGTLRDGRPYLVMERLRGVSLYDRMCAGRLSAIEVIDLLLPLCDALAAAHAAGVIHRDLKPGNVFLVEGSPGPHVKLLDWGIAKLATSSLKATCPGLVVGTPRYLAPEMARGAPATPAADIYALGVMAFEMFLEDAPFDADSPAEVMAMHQVDAPPVPHELWPDIPKRLELLLLAMLAKAPSGRPALHEVASTLRAVREELLDRVRKFSEPVTLPLQAIGAVEVDDLPRRSRWRGIAVGLGAIAAAILLIVAIAIDAGDRGAASPTAGAIAAANPTPNPIANPIANPMPMPMPIANPNPNPSPMPSSAPSPAPNRALVADLTPDAITPAPSLHTIARPNHAAVRPTAIGATVPSPHRHATAHAARSMQQDDTIDPYP